MRRSLLPVLKCPSGCVGELILSAPDGENVFEGLLSCGECGASFPIESGIPRMLPPMMLEAEDRENDRKRSEMAARDAQAQAYDKMKGLKLFGKIEIPVTMRTLKPHAHDVILEAGCGTGRMTPLFAKRCKSLVAIDFSFASLLSCSDKLKRAGVTNVEILQADVGALPLRDAFFNKTVSCQVLEHLPTPNSRMKMVSELNRVTAPGGHIALSAYQHSLYTRLFGQKEGEHAGGIYYYRFSRQELRDLLGESMRVRSMTGVLVYHYLALCERT